MYWTFSVSIELVTTNKLECINNYEPRLRFEHIYSNLNISVKSILHASYTYLYVSIGTYVL